MEYPTIVVTPGTDSKLVIKELDFLNVKYIVKSKSKSKSKSKETKLNVYTCKYPYKQKIIVGVSLANIREGSLLPFFKSAPIKLSWTISYTSWCFDSWDLDINADIWLSDKYSNEEKATLVNMLDTLIAWDSNILDIYIQVLLPAFKHPKLQTLLIKCIERKKSHINMWHYVQNKLKIPNCSRTFSKNTFSTELSELSIGLMQTIMSEKFGQISTSPCFRHFTRKGHFEDLNKLVTRRDKESEQHSNELHILMNKIEKMHPFMKCFFESTNGKIIHDTVIREMNLHIRV